MTAPQLALDESKIDAIFADLNQCRFPGAVVGIAVRGKPVYRKGFGLASLESPLLLSPSMRLRVGSITKHFTCLAYLLFCEEGKAALDDPMGKYLPELQANAKAITARQLMGHIGGLSDTHDTLMMLGAAGQAVTTEEQLAHYQSVTEIRSRPGVTWSYNNGGYIMLSVALERIAGEPLEDILRRRIFKPVGLFDTLLRRWDTDFVANSATLHMVNAQGGFEKSYIGLALAGEGGMVSTVDDLLRWLRHMRDPRVGSEKTWALLKTPLTLANGADTGYGLGLAIDRYRGISTLSHSGGVLGGNAHLLSVPAAELDVIAIVNRHDVLAAQYVNKILDVCFANLEAVSESTGATQVTATYRSPASGRVLHLYMRDGRQIVSIDGSDLMMRPDAEGVLRPAPGMGSSRRAVKLLGEGVAPAAIRYIEFGNEDELLRAAQPLDASGASLEGHYRAQSIALDAHIQSAGDGLRMFVKGRFGPAAYRLQSLAQSVWRAQSEGALGACAILTFDDQAKCFHFRTARNAAFAFKRVAA